MFSRPRIPLTSKNDNPVLPQWGSLRMSQLNDLSISGCPAYPAAESLDLSCSGFLAPSHLVQTQGEIMSYLEPAHPSQRSSSKPFWNSSGWPHLPSTSWCLAPSEEELRPQKQLQSRHYTTEACFLRPSIAQCKQISNIRIPFPFQFT